MINLTKLNVSNYNRLLAKLLGNFEADSAAAYFDSKSPNNHVTIGRGFDIEQTGSLAQQKVFATLGLNQLTGLTPAAATAEAAYVSQILRVLTGPDTTNVALQTSLNQIMANRAADPLFSGIPAITNQTTFRLTPTQIESIYTAIIEDKEKVIDRVIANRSVLPLSSERAVLVAMAYQGLAPSRSAALKVAIVADSNRAEAWYLIRYEGYMGANDGPGQAKRHFLEAQVFGLYDNPTSVTFDEANQTFAMLTKHRTEILTYEAQYGVPPDGATPSRNMIAEALLDANLASIAQPQELLAALDPAKTAFITWVNTQLPAGATPLVAANWNAAALYYNGNTAPGSIGKLDATADDGKANGLENNLMVGNDSADIITGGKGADVLVGMAGSDVLEGGDGNDKLFGGEGTDNLDGGAGADELKGGRDFDTYKADKQDSITDADGKGAVQLDNTTLGLAERKKGESDYKDSAGNKYVQAGATLIINGGLKILDWKDGDLGITLKEKDIDKIKQKAKTAANIPSPIVLDLNADGVVGTTAAGTGAHFDHEADGFAEQTGWVIANDNGSKKPKARCAIHSTKRQRARYA